MSTTAQPYMCFHCMNSTNSSGTVVSYWRKCVHEVLVNRLGGLSFPTKSVVRLTDRPNMTFDVYCERKTTTQQQQQNHCMNTNAHRVTATLYMELPSVVNPVTVTHNRRKASV